MVWARIFMIYKFLKEIWSILQLPINFSYTIDARFVNYAFMIQLSMWTMAMYIQTILVSEYITIIFCDFTQKYKISAVKKISLIFTLIGGPLIQHFMHVYYMTFIHLCPKWHKFD